MSRSALDGPVTLLSGTMSRAVLLAALREGGIELNVSATRLLDAPVFDRADSQSLTIVERSVSQLGLPDGASLSRICDRAQEIGLFLCPPTLAPYLRLKLTDQQTAPDLVLSNGQAPSGSLTVASVPLSSDPDYPKGFYLRVIGGQQWLRGYSCDDSHVWSPGDAFAFRAPSSSTVS